MSTGAEVGNDLPVGADPNSVSSAELQDQALERETRLEPTSL